jgi:hypothetical protein
MIKISLALSLSLSLQAVLTPLPLFAQDASQEAAPSVSPSPRQNMSPGDGPMEAYGKTHPQCSEWTDFCRSCKSDREKHIACATPGIACQPRDIACQATRDK